MGAEGERWREVDECGFHNDCALVAAAESEEGGALVKVPRRRFGEVSAMMGQEELGRCGGGGSRAELAPMSYSVRPGAAGAECATMNVGCRGVNRCISGKAIRCR
jgi:hypothetical protein